MTAPRSNAPLVRVTSGVSRDAPVHHHRPGGKGHVPVDRAAGERVEAPPHAAPDSPGASPGHDPAVLARKP
ncbi:hypothetical protein ABZS83_16930 [Streptomyces sp. NPDC005426]|uniref:hypothetical protein n=1 Tax=Streptomyces sp. NPDC005426 TaxID=3155344 RepID=UPI0033B9CA40